MDSVSTSLTELIHHSYLDSLTNDAISVHYRFSCMSASHSFASLSRVTLILIHEWRLFLFMSDEQIESAVSSSKTTRVRSTKSKSAPKAPDHGAEPSNPNEQKRKKKPAPKKASSSDATIDPTSTIKPKNDQSNENDPPEPSIKPKKKRAPKAEVKSEKTESVPTEKPVKMRKPKAPKRHSAAAALVPLQTISDAFENLPVTNLDDISPMNLGIHYSSLHVKKPLKYILFYSRETCQWHRWHWNVFCWFQRENDHRSLFSFSSEDRLLDLCWHWSMVRGSFAKICSDRGEVTPEKNNTWCK